MQAEARFSLPKARIVIEDIFHDNMPLAELHLVNLGGVLHKSSHDQTLSASIQAFCKLKHYYFLTLHYTSLNNHILLLFRYY
jgi:hypothetical protein